MVQIGVFDAGFQEKLWRVSEFLWLGLSGSSRILLAENLHTPNKGGRPKVKWDRPAPYVGFDGFTSVNNFVRGAIRLLHQQGKSIRDIDAAQHTHFTTISDVVKECEEGKFLKEEISQSKGTPEKAVKGRFQVRTGGCFFSTAPPGAV